jgi:hypothetical protein
MGLTSNAADEHPAGQFTWRPMRQTIWAQGMIEVCSMLCCMWSVGQTVQARPIPGRGLTSSDRHRRHRAHARPRHWTPSAPFPTLSIDQRAHTASAHSQASSPVNGGVTEPAAIGWACTPPPMDRARVHSTPGSGSSTGRLTGRVSLHNTGQWSCVGHRPQLADVFPTYSRRA